MYGKIFVQIYDGSLYGRWQALVTFQQLIVLADQDGIIDMMPEAIAARTSIPIEIIRQGLTELEQPDPKSRTPDEDGRRIIRISETRDWGWQITNYAHYRAIRTAEERREYFREHKRKQRAKKSTEVHQSPPAVTKSPLSPPIVEVEAEVEGLIDDRSSVRLAVIANSAIAERWGEQPSPLTHGSAVKLATELAAIPSDVVKESIYRQCRASNADLPPSSVNYFRKGILADWDRHQSKAAQRLVEEKAPLAAGTGALILSKIRGLVKEHQQPGQRIVRYVPRAEVEALGADVVRAYDAVGGADTVLNTPPDKFSFLIRDFTQALEASRA